MRYNIRNTKCYDQLLYCSPNMKRNKEGYREPQCLSRNTSSSPNPLKFPNLRWTTQITYRQHPIPSNPAPTWRQAPSFSHLDQKLPQLKAPSCSHTKQTNAPPQPCPPPHAQRAQSKSSQARSRSARRRYIPSFLPSLGETR